MVLLCTDVRRTRFTKEFAGEETARRNGLGGDSAKCGSGGRRIVAQAGHVSCHVVADSGQNVEGYGEDARVANGGILIEEFNPLCGVV